MTLKTRTVGRVTEVGWGPNSPKTVATHAIIKVNLGTSRQKEQAEQKIKALQERILGKKVVIFLEE